MKDHHNMKPLLAATPPASPKKHRLLRHLRSKRTYTGLFVLAFVVIGVALIAASRAAVAVNSVKSGPWSAASTWSGGRVPQGGDVVTIEAGHTVTFDVTTSPKLGETNVKGTLTFDPNKNTKFITNQNLIVTGKLVMKPANANVEQFIQFVEVDETKFVGGGMDPIASDVGMWVIDSGQLDIAGAPKTSWTSLTGAAAQGATSITVKDTPTGWRVGDTIMIAPNEPPTVGAASYQAFDECDITAISGKTISFNKCTSGSPAFDPPHNRKETTGLSRQRPLVNNKWTAEVGNLTRNVRIEGTYTFKRAGERDWEDQDRHNGNSHIFIRANKPQFISNAQLRYMGSAGMDESQRTRDDLFKLGRYAIHMHMMGDASRGSVIDGTVVRDANFHSFVTHASHGVVLKNNIAYKVKSAAFWWDPHDLDKQSDSHDIVWDHNLVANTVSGRHYGMSFFFLAGIGNKAINNVAVGIQDTGEQGGFAWFNGDHGVWAIDNNITHNNNQNGIQVWQNSPHLHPIGNFASYHNQTFGIIHGAYANDYHYFNGEVYGNRVGGIKLQANAGTIRQQKFENMVWDGAGITPNLIVAAESALPPGAPTLFHDNVFKNWTQRAVLVDNLINENPKQLDIVNSTFQGPGTAIAFGNNNSAEARQASRVRVQPSPGSGAPYQINSDNSKVAIAPFGPESYGTGNGLLAEYFTGNFDTKVYTRRETTVSESYAEDDTLPPLWISPWGRPFTGRWTGEFQAQFSQPYTFARNRDVGMRIWVNNQLVLDAWQPSDQTVWGSPIQLVKNQKYPIRVEVNFPQKEANPSRDTQIFNAYVRSAGQPGEASQYPTVLPHSQLYCGSNPICNINPGAGLTSAPLPPPPTPDTTAPTVSITSPANNAPVSGAFNVTVNASDNSGVSRVELLVDGQIRSTDSSAPYTFSLNTTELDLDNGNHTVTARAHDTSGNTANSTTVTLNVNNPAPPAPEPMPTPTFEPEDINEDGKVNLLDFSQLVAKYGQTTNLGRADINGDGRINILDFSRLLAKYIRKS